MLLIVFSCLEGKRKFKCAAHWVLKNHVEKIKAKNVVYLYMRDEGSIHSHLGVPFFSKNRKIIIIRMNWVKGEKEVWK